MGRIAARALETSIMAKYVEQWVDELDSNMSHGKVTIFNPIHWDPATWPDHAMGYVRQPGALAGHHAPAGPPQARHVYGYFAP